ncbi:2-isopropylmalate synthase [Xanthobacter agilis]|uniref:2-isopropylmalate synthase n=1 Tax=Xanthobacter agilis TaxID=47492 RepID=A0ABU0LAL6_XANAG|nr:2-isopropylmalate synthase [Xanthobacter agilis]MDQ0504175.1 2-isopropylmalate synthase [Xanthobacter agilis]
MLRDPSIKYAPFAHVDLPDRTWPSRTITKAPRWLSTDLRDGNQALVDPMDAEKKRRFLDMLLKIGLKEIEVGFPSASQTEFDFIRHLVEGDLIPDDVHIQVLTQARRDLIERTFESLRGAPRAIVHLYNAISPAWRRIVFGLDRAGIKDIAVKGVTILREQAEKYPETRWTYEYSPETFSTAEPDFAIEVCEAVLDVLQPTPDHPVILNLPATVEAAGPHVYADQIERFCRQISRRDSVVVSVHPHNDRGTGVAAAELAVQAGADRVEGCLFGNGERTGNVDLVTLALNLYTQGVDPGLDFSDIQSVVQTVQYCNQIPVHPRHPYAGELVFTAFSGSHQDAIKKGLEAQAARNDISWDVPYLPIDPADLGCSYEAVIRVNSQSGKGGVAWVLEQDKGLKLPRALQVHFSRIVQSHADETGRELTATDIWAIFQDTYLPTGDRRFDLIDHRETGSPRSPDRMFVGRVSIGREERSISGRGNGLLSSVLAALKADCDIDMDILDYQEHAIGHGGDARAAAYVQCQTADGRVVFGVGIDTNVATASVRAVLSAANGLG